MPTTIDPAARLVQHLIARDDEHGRRRSLFVFYDGDGQVVQVVRQTAEKARYPAGTLNMPKLLTHHIPTKDYRLLLEFAARKGWLSSEEEPCPPSERDRAPASEENPQPGHASREGLRRLHGERVRAMREKLDDLKG